MIKIKVWGVKVQGEIRPISPAIIEVASIVTYQGSLIHDGIIYPNGYWDTL